MYSKRAKNEEENYSQHEEESSQRNKEYAQLSSSSTEIYNSPKQKQVVNPVTPQTCATESKETPSSIVSQKFAHKGKSFANLASLSFIPKAEALNKGWARKLNFGDSEPKNIVITENVESDFQQNSENFNECLMNLEYKLLEEATVSSICDESLPINEFSSDNSEDQKEQFLFFYELSLTGDELFPLSLMY